MEHTEKHTRTQNTPVKIYKQMHAVNNILRMDKFKIKQILRIKWLKVIVVGESGICSKVNKVFTFVCRLIPIKYTDKEKNEKCYHARG